MNNISNNRTEHNLFLDERKKRDEQRRGKIFRFRVKYGVKSLFYKPWKIVFVALLVGAFLICWLNRDTVISPLLADFPVLPIVPILTYMLYALIIVILVFLLVLLLYVLGTPLHARRIDRAIVDIFKNEVGYGFWPIYLSRQREGSTGLWRYTFYSEHVPIEVWDAKNARLVNMLSGYIESVEHGGRDGNDVHYITVISGHGAKPEERATTPDPLFRK